MVITRPFILRRIASISSSRAGYPRISGITLSHRAESEVRTEQGYHWFFGAGMVHAFHFDNGRVNYANRWARTPKFEAEQAAGKPCL